jgi:hypothetical protein
MIGKRFFRLTVISMTKPYEWLCKCDCGETKITKSCLLINGNVKSCGCYRKEFGKTHGRSVDSAYKAWNQMKSRCGNKKHQYYEYYGGKGITVCEKWKTFEGFVDDMGEKPTTKHTLDRIDGTKGYYKENCRWATRLEQAQNIRSNRNITWNGRTMSLSAWGRETGIGMKTLQYRLDAKWPLDKVFTHIPFRNHS